MKIYFFRELSSYRINIPTIKKYKKSGSKDTKWRFTALLIEASENVLKEISIEIDFMFRTRDLVAG